MAGLFLQYQDIVKNLTKDQFAQNLKNGSDIYEHVHPFIYIPKFRRNFFALPIFFSPFYHNPIIIILIILMSLTFISKLKI